MFVHATRRADGSVVEHGASCLAPPTGVARAVPAWRLSGRCTCRQRRAGRTFRHGSLRRGRRGRRTLERRRRPPWLRLRAVSRHRPRTHGRRRRDSSLNGGDGGHGERLSWPGTSSVHRLRGLSTSWKTQAPRRNLATDQAMTTIGLPRQVSVRGRQGRRRLESCVAYSFCAGRRSDRQPDSTPEGSAAEDQTDEQHMRKASSTLENATDDELPCATI